MTSRLRFCLGATVCSLLIGSQAHAYIFNYASSGFAAYLRGTVADTLQGDEAYSRTSGDSTEFSDKVKYGFSGEVGFQYSFSDKVAFRLGVEGYQGKTITANGMSFGGTSLLDVTSLVTVINPNLALDYSFLKGTSSRVYFLAGAGYAMATVNNDYSLTSTGQSTYGASSSDLTDKWKGTSISYIAGLGAEYYAFDNVSFSLEAGYRMMQFTKFTYADDGTAVRGGAVVNETKGSIVGDNGGSQVSINMSGYFVGAVIRFYLPQMK